MNFLFFLNLIFLLVTKVNALPVGWAPITDGNRKVCSEASVCKISQKLTGDEFQILFSISDKDDMLWLNNISIINVKTKASKSYSPINFQGMFKNTPYGLYALDLNKDGYLDLAIFASLAAKEGEMYLYWLYDSKTKTFVFTNEHFPELVMKKKGLLESLGNNEKFRINKNYKISAVPSK